MAISDYPVLKIVSKSSFMPLCIKTFSFQRVMGFTINSNNSKQKPLRTYTAINLILSKEYSYLLCIKGKCEGPQIGIDFWWYHENKNDIFNIWKYVQTIMFRPLCHCLWYHVAFPFEYSQTTITLNLAGSTANK